MQTELFSKEKMMEAMKVHTLAQLVRYFKPDCVFRDYTFRIIGSGKVAVKNKVRPFVIVKEKGRYGKTFLLFETDSVSLGSPFTMGTCFGEAPLRLTVFSDHFGFAIGKRKDGKQFGWRKSLVYEYRDKSFDLVEIDGRKLE